MIQISSGRGDQLHVELLEGVEMAQASGDIRLSVSVRSSQFQGRIIVWVAKEAAASFSRAAMRLNETLQGCAVLESISPDELHIEVLAASPRGYLTIQGSLGCRVCGEEQRQWHKQSIVFGFEFEPSQLHALVRELWVAKNAA
jgi:hypothetical protein